MQASAQGELEGGRTLERVLSPGRGQGERKSCPVLDRENLIRRSAGLSDRREIEGKTCPTCERTARAVVAPIARGAPTARRLLIEEQSPQIFRNLPSAAFVAPGTEEESR